jgi:hypothetical protein
LVDGGCVPFSARGALEAGFHGLGGAGGAPSLRFGGRTKCVRPYVSRAAP